MEEIYKFLTKGVRKPTKNKIGIFVCGAAGSGKSKFKHKYIEDIGLTTTYVFLNIDDVWVYTKGENTSDVFKNIVSKTINDGYSFYYEGTCRYPDRTIEQIKHAKEKGYKTKLVFVYAELDTVIKRIKERVDQPLKPEFAKIVYSQIKNHAKDYMKSDLFDEIYLYNNQKTSNLIFYKDKKEVHCISPESKFYFDVSKYC
jgi:predicted ABC-type ATPase